MVYVDPLKLMSRQLSLMDVVNAINKTNQILPAGDVKIGPFDYYVYSNALVDQIADLDDAPIKTVDQRWVSVRDIGEAKDANQIQYDLVRVDGQRSAYLPILKAGGNTNTIQVVDGIRSMIKKLTGIPKNLEATVVFDQSAYVKEAIRTLLHEGLIGLLLTSLMILLFLASLRATFAVFLSIPLSALATFVVLSAMGSTINTMILGGLALAFSRIMDNSVISLENIYRHLEQGASPAEAAEQGGTEVGLAVLAATLTTIVVFFPVTFLYGVSKFLFTALAIAVGISLFASYFVAMTVIPLFCSRYLRREAPPATDGPAPPPSRTSLWARFHAAFDRAFNRFLDFYEATARRVTNRPLATVLVLSLAFLASLAIYPFLGLAFFPRTDAGQFTINLKAPTGTRIEATEQYVAQVEDLARKIVGPSDFQMVVSNIGLVPDFSALYNSNAGEYTATIQVALKTDHKVNSFDYMDRVRSEIKKEYPDLRTFFSTGSMVDAILNMGMPAPIDLQVSGTDIQQIDGLAKQMAEQIRGMKGVGETYIPQDINYPALRLNVDRVHAAELGLDPQSIVQNVITALNSNLMIAPNYWVDRKTGNDYFLTVQYYENGPPSIHGIFDLKNIPLRAPNLKQPTTLDQVVDLKRLVTPTELDHYQVQREIDVYVSPSGEDLGGVRSRVEKLVNQTSVPAGVAINIRGVVQGMQQSFPSFAYGLSLAMFFCT